MPAIRSVAEVRYSVVAEVSDVPPLAPVTVAAARAARTPICSALLVPRVREGEAALTRVLGANLEVVLRLVDVRDEDAREQEVVDVDDALVDVRDLTDDLGAGRVVARGHFPGGRERGGLAAGDRTDHLLVLHQVDLVEGGEHFAREDLEEESVIRAGAVYLAQAEYGCVCHCCDCFLSEGEKRVVLEFAFTQAQGSDRGVLPRKGQAHQLRGVGGVTERGGAGAHHRASGGVAGYALEPSARDAPLLWKSAWLAVSAVSRGLEQFGTWTSQCGGTPVRGTPGRPCSADRASRPSAPREKRTAARRLPIRCRL
jgi:hypothetical protein